MIKFLKQNKNTFTLAIISVIIFVSIVAIPIFNIITAETIEPTYHYLYSSQEYKVFANDRKIATMRLSTYVAIRANGESLYIVQAEIHPLLNDGRNDYLVKEVKIDVDFGTDSIALLHASTTVNSTNAVLTYDRQTNKTSCSNGSSSFVLEDGVGLRSDYNENNIIFDESNKEHLGTQHVTYTVTPRESIKNGHCIFTAAHFIRFYPGVNRPFNFSARLYGLEIEGVLFAPNFEGSNQNWISIDGSGDSYSYLTAQRYFDNPQDGHQSDYFDFVSTTNEY